MNWGSSGSGDDSEKDSRSECSALGTAVDSSTLDISGSFSRYIVRTAVDWKGLDDYTVCSALEETASKASRALEGSLPMLRRIQQSGQCWSGEEQRLRG